VSHVGHICDEDLVKEFECCRRDRPPVSSTVYLLFTMADHRLENTARTTDSSQAAEIGSSTISTSGPATRILSSEASAIAQFSLELRELEAANTLGTLGVVPETQWSSTQAIMHKLSTDSVVTFRKVIGSAEILPARPGIDPFEDTRPMSDLSCIQQSPLTEASPCVIARPRTQPGSVPPVSSYIFGLQSENFGHQPEHGSTLAHHTADPTSLHGMV